MYLKLKLRLSIDSTFYEKTPKPKLHKEGKKTSGECAHECNTF